MKFVLVAVAALVLASPVLADQKSEARKALGSGQAFQPSGYQVDGPTYYNSSTFAVDGGIRHRRDRIDPSDKRFWQDRDRENGGSNFGDPAPSK